MRRFLTVAIPIVMLAIFIVVMLSGSFLKKPFGKNDNLPSTIKLMINDVNNEDWEKLSEEVDKLDNMWKRIIKRVQFSVERDELNFLSTNIARLRGAIMAEDKASALIELSEAFNHWKELGE